MRWFGGSLQHSPASLPSEGEQGKHLQRRLRAGSVRFHCVSGSGLGRSQGRGQTGCPVRGGKKSPRPALIKILSSKSFSLELKKPGWPGKQSESLLLLLLLPTCQSSCKASLQGRRSVAASSGHQGAALSRLLRNSPRFPAFRIIRKFPLTRCLCSLLQCARSECLALARCLVSFPSLNLPLPDSLHDSLFTFQRNKDHKVLRFGLESRPRGVLLFNINMAGAVTSVTRRLYGALQEQRSV